MEMQHNFIKHEVATILTEAIKSSFPDHKISLSDVYRAFNKTPSLKAGHLAYPTFLLAKPLRKAPPVIAQEILKNITPSPLIKSIKAQGPYLNIFYNLSAVTNLLLSSINSKQFFQLDIEDKPQTKMFEYSQPNTHKELHVGHMRNICLGNALVRLNGYLKHKVIPVTYPGDMGTHVARCLWFLKYHNTLAAPEGDKGTWLGDIYALATNKISSLPEDEKSAALQQLTMILKEIDAQDGEFFELWKQTREWSIDLFKQTYKWADVDFDQWYYESEVDASSLQRIEKLYQDGKLIKDDNAIGMDLSDDGLGFCMLIKSDGNGLYATKDIELAFSKFEEFKLDESIYIVDKRQAHHFKQVFKTLEHIGFPKAKNCLHLEYDFVELPSGAMSSRKGNIIPLMDLISKMESTIKERFLARHEDWPKSEIDQLATIIANGAIKYGMICIDNSRKIVFDMDEWLKLDGETGPYLQYVHARIATMLNKFPMDDSTDVNFELLTASQEEALIIHLSSFNDIVYQAASQYKTSVLTSYLFDLGKLFNSFYAECPIGKADDPKLKKVRLYLAASVKETMKVGLSLLGIQAPDRM